MGPTTGDAKWVRQSFLVEAGALEAVDVQNRFFSTASIKFTDTTLGGNLAINPPPQFTRNADLRPANKSRYKESLGMGRYYSEAIDDHSQLIYLRAGLPAFNSMTQFFSDFYSSDAGQLARTGRSTGLFYAVGYAAGFVVSILSWKLLAVQLLGFGYRILVDKPKSKFYYSKPAMPLYWNSVQTIVNQIAVNKGIVPRIGGNDAQQRMNDQYEFAPSDVKRLHEAFPAMFNSGGSIDVYAMATRAQRLARQHNDLYKQRLDAAGVDVETAIAQVYQTDLRDDRNVTYRGYLENWLKTEAAQPTGSAASSDSEITGAINSAAASGTEAASTAEPKAPDTASENIGLLTNPSNPATAFAEFLKAEWDDGGAFASFRVDATGTVNEQFTNQAADSELATKLNNLSSQARNMAFDFQNGNIIGGPVGDMIGGVINTVKSLAQGAADSMKLSGLAMLGGAAFVDIPKHWVSSAAQLPRSTYTIKLVSPYGNPFSQMMNIYIPLAMLLALALPLSTGKQSYTSPFLVELYDQGRCLTRLGLVDSMSVTRGIGNTGWNSAGQALGIEVTFTILDLSSVMHMPINAGFNFRTAVDTVAGGIRGALGGGTIGSIAGVVGPVTGAVGVAAGAAGGAALGAAAGLGVFDDDNAFTDYMNILGSTSLADLIYPMRRFKKNLTTKLADFNSWRSVSHMASFAGDLLPSRIISAFYRGTVR